MLRNLNKMEQRTLFVIFAFAFLYSLSTAQKSDLVRYRQSSEPDTQDVECWTTPYYDLYWPVECDPSDAVNCAFCHRADFHYHDYCEGYIYHEWEEWTDYTEPTCASYCTYEISRFRCRGVCCDGCTFPGPHCAPQPDETQVDYFDECIDKCELYVCDGPPPSVCTKCHNTTSCDDPTCAKAYHLQDNSCHPRCNWLEHWCWPGTCDIDNNYLASTCSCMEGFELYTPDGETTKCKLKLQPEIHTCRLRVASEYGELATTQFVNGSTACDTTIDGYINFPPVGAYFHFHFQFMVENIPEQNDYNRYASREGFGIIAADISVLKYSTTGQVTEIESHDMSQYNCSVPFSREEPAQGQIVSCEDTHQYSQSFADLLDGEKICHKYTAHGSGFVYITDIYYNTPEVRHDEYGDTLYEEERCFITDFTAPDHCLNVDPDCGEDVLNFGERIRRDLELIVSFDGWFDPQPDSTVASASGMKEYELELRDVIYTPVELYADWSSFASNITQAGNPIDITLPDRGQPHMFAIYVWALDSTQESSNYRIARRFVLVDNTSDVEISEDNPIIPVTGNPDSDYEWQVELIPVVVDWTNHFYNNWHVHTNLLLPIRGETNTSQPIVGIFEQETGDLPVSGTDNVDGVVNFQYKYYKTSVAGNEETELKDVPDPLSQTVTLETTIQDGDTLEITINAIDIMNNTLNDSITLFVDSTPPIVEEMYLMKDGYRYLFVHNTTDLSEMEMVFTAYDPHSGDQRVLWRLGHEPGLADVGQGALPVIKLSGNETCDEGEPCYCPIIGPCEIYNYSVPLDGLIPNDTHEGSHNRQYFFTFEVMNEAHLTTIEVVKILVDDSPPETGYVFDGPVGSPDRDFQSDFTLDWHWVGFIDHESGISKYHYGIGRECYTKEQLQFLDDNTTIPIDAFALGETTDTFVNIEAENLGIHRISVIAFNGAMEPSEAVCSSGVVLDVTPPVIKEVSLTGAYFTESVICDVENRTIYGLNNHGTLRILSATNLCMDLCGNASTSVDIHRFTAHALTNGSLSEPLTIDESNEFCTQFLTYDEESPIYLSNDNIDILWNYFEPESQMLDYYLGLSTTGQVIAEPDITGFVSSHNRTEYKCYHCGLSHADQVYFNIKAINKANLEDHFIFGPVIVDLTSPVCTCDIQVSIGNETTFFRWQKSCCMDNEDARPLTDYTWSLGTSGHLTEVISLQEYQVAHDDVLSMEWFEIAVETSIIQQHDQDYGHSYLFTLHSYNRAGLFSTISSEPFQVHSKQLPSTGTVLHTADISSTEPIGFQENIDKLCAYWFGFTHHQEALQFSIAVGTDPYMTDVSDFVNASNLDRHCVSGLNLVPFQQYFVTIRASNSQGYSLATTHGIVVGSMVEMLKNASISFGEGCPESLDHLLYSNTSDPENETVVYDWATFELSVDFELNLPMTSFAERTIRIKLGDISFDDIAELSVYVDANYVPLSAWKFFKKDVLLFYTFVQEDENLTLTLTSSNDDLLIRINEIALHECIESAKSQYATVPLTLQFSLNPKTNAYMSHYEISVSYTEDELNFISVGNSTKTHIDVPYANNTVHYVHVRPCFTITCINHVTSYFVLDTIPPEPQSVTASLHRDPQAGFRDTNTYVLAARWDEFLVARGEGYVTAYDYGIALKANGSGMATKWSRLAVREHPPQFEIEQLVELPVHKYRTMYFIIRCSNDAGLTKIFGQKLDLHDLAPISGIQVFDFSLEYNLDPINDYLQSSNLGNKTSVLHDMDLDFLNSTRGIAGAVSGIACDQYQWMLQRDPETSCFEEMDTANCISAKTSLKNTVKFTRAELNPGFKYHVCVKTDSAQCPSLYSCSNGFIVDTEKPEAGTVFIGMSESEDPSVQISDSSLLIRWTGFYDEIYDIKSGYIESIMEYQVAIGSSPNSEDVRPFRSVGMSNHTVVTNVKFSQGRQFYATVKACDHVGLCTSVASPPFVVDITPPTVGKVFMSLGRNGMFGINVGDIIIRLQNVKDLESGIKERYIGIGTTPISDDVLPLSPVQSDTFVVDASDTLHDGLQYYAVVKVVNRGGLLSIVSSDAFYYDSSPPQTGYVRFGDSSNGVEAYTNNTQSISVHWGGFIDPHSGVVSYRFSLGTSPLSTDVIQWKNMGINQDYSAEVNLIPGQEYYASAEACNSVLLCSIAVSHRLVADDSPPLPGIVHVGYGDDHAFYLSNTNSLKLQWIGFDDVQSGIQYVDVCVSTQDNVCNVFGPKRIFHGNDVVLSEIILDTGVNYSASIEACNQVHLCTSGASHVFTIDTSPPTIVVEAHLSTYSSLKPDTQFDRSYISLSWEMTDDIPMLYYTLSLLSHHDGEIPIENVIVGDITSTTVTLSQDEQLNDGTLYTAKIVGCNAAHLCTVSETPSFLVDSSPPLLGGFVKPMHWNNEATGSMLDLAWEGFVDPHSSVTRYFLMVSSDYNGYDLSEGIIAIPHDNSSYTQRHTISLPTHQLVLNSKLYLSIWAENGVGVTSDAAKASVFVLQQSNGTGILDIEKHSCEVHYCNNDCTCAVVNQKCETHELPPPCFEYNATDNNVHVYDGVYGSQIHLSASSACLPGYWISNYTSTSVTRFEWSVGMKGYDPGFGIFDIIEDKIWFDVEMYDRAIYCLPVGEKVLLQGESYIYHTRVWHSFSNHTIYRSIGVLIDTTPPVVGLGKHVRDTDADFVEDIDFTSRIQGIYADWNNVFSDAESGITSYSVAIGTTSGGNEIYGPENVGLQTNISLPTVPLTAGAKYYTTVYAFNGLSMSVFDISDGLMVDRSPPTKGSVYTSYSFMDQSHHSYILRASWLGFADKESYVREYMYSVTPSGELPEFQPAGIMNHIEEDISGFGHGSQYVVHVKAIDAAGHESEVAQSNIITIDLTPPIILTCGDPTPVYESYLDCESQPVVNNSPVEYSVCSTNETMMVGSGEVFVVELYSSTDHELNKGRLEIGPHSDWIVFNHMNGNLFKFETYFVATEEDIVSPMVFFSGAADETYHVVISQCIDSDQTSKHPTISLSQAGYLGVRVLHPAFDPESDISSIKVGLGTNPGGFQLVPLEYIGPQSVSFFQLPLQHRMKVYATCIVLNNGGLRLTESSDSILIDWTAPLVENITSTMRQTDGDLYTFEAKWNAVDEESNVTGCFWNIGSTMGDDDILPYTPTDTSSTSAIEDVHIFDTDHVFVTVTCANHLNFKSSISGRPNLLPSNPPSSDDAIVKVLPTQYTYFIPRDSMQANASEFAFTFGGFGDQHEVDHYEYRIRSGDATTDWVSVGKMDYLVLWQQGSNGQSIVDVFVRSVDGYGTRSDSVEDTLIVDGRTPQITGENLAWQLSGTTLDLDWSHVFNKQSVNGTLTYQLYVGTQEASADYVIGLETTETDVTVTSTKLEAPSTVSCVITAISASGTHATYRETLYL